MIKTYTFGLLFLFFTIAAQAQFTDDFNDGNFNANPTWSGDDSLFIVNASNQLQSNSSTTNNTFYLSTSSALANNAQWELYVKLTFSTSSANYVDIFLISDQINLKSALNGYFVRIGGTPDEISLYRKDGNSIVKIIDGVDGRSQPTSSNNEFRIRVKRNAVNDWSLEDDNTGIGNTYFTEGIVNDNTYTTSNFFGISITQSTSSFFGKHFFDDIYVGSIITDTVPPQINSVTVINSSSLDVFFSEPVDQTSAETISNYSVNNIGSPQTAQRDASNLSLVHLSFAGSFPSGVIDTLVVNNVIDIALNAIVANSIATFTYTVPVTPSAFDLVINEIMADPDPAVGLPAGGEYVELFNRSNKTFDLSGWTFSDASSSVSFGSQTILPGGFIIICSSSSQVAFSAYGTAIGFSSFPSLNNTGGETLTLRDNTSKIIDQVFYDETFYQDLTKSGGGWSIERIDPDFTCINKLNWKASVDIKGGTPGSINSIDGALIDNVAPAVLHACPTDSNHVQLFFSEPLADTALSNINNYILQTSSGINTPINAVPAADFLSVTLTTPFNIITQNGVIEIKISPAVADCPGNMIGTNSTFFQWGQNADSGDVVINEILFSAKTGGAEFVELYNRSNKAIDVKDLRITRIDLTTGIADPPVEITTECYVLLPYHYLVLTDKPDAVKSQYTTDPNAFIQMNLPDLLTDEDIIVLQDAASHTIDQLHYYSSWQFPLLNDLHGVSLERINPNRTTQDKSNWHSASETSGFATPGLRNSQYSEVIGDGSSITVDPEIFSPDNDGTNDVTNITYHFDEPGFTANVDVFDDRGRLITHLVKNQLLGTDGSWSWNGITDKNEKARIGIYIIYMEAFDLKGDVKKYKKTCVLAGKL